MVYSYNTREKRGNLWSYMENVNMGCTWTWIVMGDFNLVLNMVDRLGGKSINSCELIELPPKGSK